MGWIIVVIIIGVLLFFLWALLRASSLQSRWEEQREIEKIIKELERKNRARKTKRPVGKSNKTTRKNRGRN